MWMAARRSNRAATVSREEALSMAASVRALPMRKAPTLAVKGANEEMRMRSPSAVESPVTGE